MFLLTNFYLFLLFILKTTRANSLKREEFSRQVSKKSAVGKVLAGDPSAKKKRPKTSKPNPKQPSGSKKARVEADEEKAKKEEAKEAREAEKVEAEKRRDAGIAARIAQAAKRISSSNQQNDAPNLCAEPHQEGNNGIHPLSLPAFRSQSPSTADPSSKKQNVTPQAPKRISQHQQNVNPQPCHENIHPLSLPAFRQSPSTSTDPSRSSASKNQPVNRTPKTPC